MRPINTLLILCMILVSCNFSYSQVNSLENKHTSEIVFLRDSHLKSIIKEIIKKDRLCQTYDVQWSIEFLKNNMILITKYSLENLIASKGIDNIYSTIIDDNFLFISGNNNFNNIFSKSGYSIDLISFLNKENFSTIDYSFWIIQKKEDSKYKVIKEKKYRCN